MRYSVTLKNAFNHLVNTAEGKQKFHRAALLELAWLQLRGRIPTVPLQGPPFWLFEPDMKHISMGPELSDNLCNPPGVIA